jgi:hypothetical protein
VSIVSSIPVSTSGGEHGEAMLFESGAEPAIRGKIDELVFARLAKAGIQPASLSSDEVFLRRVYLDAIGTLPTAQEASGFLADPDPKKRSALIDRLLERDEFADLAANKWSDLLRIKAEFPINLWPAAAQEYYRWLRSAMRENKPYDQFVRELLTLSGSNFRVGAVNFYRALQNREPQAVAQAVALTFMGTRADAWPAVRLRDMAVFFSQIAYKPTGEWKEEIVFWERSKPLPADAGLPDNSRVRLQPDRDPREVFAEWLVSPKNPWFARNLANRVWAWLFGRGLVHEPDDIRPDNPPSHPDVLAYLEQELVTGRFDVKHIYRLVLNSSVYQLSSVARSDHADAEKLFAFYPVRRLDAEVLIDAICQVTGTTEQYASAVPEPYTIMPDGQRGIALPDGSISSPFLELFGRPPRDTGLESERNNRPSAAQRLHLLNSSHVERKIEQGPAMQGLLRGANDPVALARNLYLTILSRYPTDDELKIVSTYSTSSGINRRQAAIDVAWALINSSEFLYRH